ncbi:MAG: hypothetical protein LBH39_01570 [Clostridiales Family XIII bacterium]|jgi:hypothetical protein|nr:hypothetical protein [Clostridiales Family XIII bacterium]
MNKLHAKSKKGSFTVEAAIFLPIFIIGILSIAYILKVIAIQENVFNSLSDEARNIAAEASIVPYPAFFNHDVAERVRAENGSEIERFRISMFLYRYGISDYTDQIRVTADYDVKVKLPAAFVDRIPVSDTILCRAFVGKLNTSKPMDADEFKEEKESVTVWVFPRSGTKYHKEDCSYVKVYPKEVALNEGVRKKYEPCGICKPRELGNGSLVYCFQTSGEVFHRADCPVVERYVVSMEKEEAESRGYTPCSVCGGH